MDQGWAAVAATTAAGVFGIAGTLTGITVGRRQTTDQADVEHQQWLRGQRQDAYVQLLEAWDQAVGKLETLVNDWDLIYREMDEHGQADEFTDAIQSRTGGAWQMAASPLERVALLGPGDVDTAVQGMETVFDDTQAWLNEQAAPDAPAWEVGRWMACLSRLHRARHAFTVVARKEIRAAPRPGR